MLEQIEAEFRDRIESDGEHGPPMIAAVRLFHLYVKKQPHRKAVEAYLGATLEQARLCLLDELERQYPELMKKVPGDGV